MKVVLTLLAVLFCLSCVLAKKNNWYTIDYSGTGPLPRDAIAAHSFDDGIYTFGGFSENLDPNNPRPNIYYNDVWRFNTNSKKWQLRSPTPDPVNGMPAARAYSLAGRVGNEFIVGFGINYTADFSVITTFNDLWGFNVKNNKWRMIQATNNANGPSARAELSAKISKGKLYIFGGVTDQFTTMSDTWVYDFSSNTWTEVVTSPSPSGRYGSLNALDKDNDRVYIYGGERTEYNPSTQSLDFVFAGPDTTWYLDLNALTWTQVTPSLTLSDRNNGNGAVFVEGKLFAFGGDIGGGSNCTNVIFDQNNVRETWIYNSDLNTWNQMCPATNPPNLKRATSVLVDDTVYMFGGFAFDTLACGPFIFNTDVWAYELDNCLGGRPCASVNPVDD